MKTPTCKHCGRRDWTREAPTGTLAPNGGITLDTWRCDVCQREGERSVQRTLNRMATRRSARR